MKVNSKLDENSNNNEIYFLLRENITKYFKDDFKKNYLPYINSFQENNIINAQLFLFNNEKLKNYIIYFFKKKKKEKIDNNKNNFIKYLENDLKLQELKNRNIFGIMRYINSLEIYFENNNKFYSKMKLMKYQESYHSENINIKNFKTKFHYLNSNN